MMTTNETKVEKETLGSASVKLLSQGDKKQPVIETQREMQKNYMENLVTCAKEGEKRLGCEKPFYLCVQTRKERLLTNVIRSQFYVRQTRPLPQYDLALYWYDPKDERIEFIWCIPNRDTVEDMIYKGNTNGLEKDQVQLYNFCVGFKNGTLI
jgi:hypothetical protein